MTTEREFEEWAEKIRRVRGQAPRRHMSRRQQPRSPLFRVLLFLSALAIALMVSNHRQQPKINREFRDNNPPELRL
jgi:hypothetical protein